MNRKLNIILTIFATLVFSYMGLAQIVQKKSTQQTTKKGLPIKITEQEAVTSTPLRTNSQEYRRIAEDKKFLAACEILAADGGMFVAESGQLLRNKEKFAVTFNVVNEAGKSTEEYKQLVYAFDGKEATVYFNEKNDNFTPVESTGGSTQKLKWPPSWWIGSGGGSSSGGLFQSWGEWREVEIDNCHFSFVCPVIHAGKMRREERISKSNPNNKQNRWILIRCGCI